MTYENGSIRPSLIRKYINFTNRVKVLFHFSCRVSNFISRVKAFEKMEWNRFEQPNFHDPVISVVLLFIEDAIACIDNEPCCYIQYRNQRCRRIIELLTTSAALDLFGRKGRCQGLRQARASMEDYACIELHTPQTDEHRGRCSQLL